MEPFPGKKENFGECECPSAPIWICWIQMAESIKTGNFSLSTQQPNFNLGRDHFIESTASEFGKKWLSKEKKRDGTFVDKQSLTFRKRSWQMQEEQPQIFWWSSFRSVDPDGKMSGFVVSSNVPGIPDRWQTFRLSQFQKGGARPRQLSRPIMVERVKSSTNPSARYEAESMAGVNQHHSSKKIQSGIQWFLWVITGTPLNLGFSTQSPTNRKSRINWFIKL